METIRSCLVGIGKKLPKYSGKNTFVKYLSKMWYIWSKNMKGMTNKVEILHRDQSYPALQKTSKQLLCQWPPSWCKYIPNIFIHKNHQLTDYHGKVEQYSVGADSSILIMNIIHDNLS